MRRAVFLDRDGVLNRAFVFDHGKSHPPADLDQLEILPGVAEACAGLRRAGFSLIVATNQPDVARGSQSRNTVESINDELCRRVPIDDIRVCYHDDVDDCPCRKPRPGLLIDAAREWGVPLAGSFMVGDRWKDVEAGRRAGCTTVLITAEYSEKEKCKPDFEAGSLYEASQWILNEASQRILTSCHDPNRGI